MCFSPPRTAKIRPLRPEDISCMEECKIPVWERQKMFQPQQGVFPFPELQFSRGELNFKYLCYSVIYTSRKFGLFIWNTLVLNTIYSLCQNWLNLTKLVTPRMDYYGESYMKYTTYCRESMLCGSFITRSQNSLCRLLWGVFIASGESIMKIKKTSLAFKERILQKVI